MAGLYKRGKGYYAIFYVGGHKQRISLQTDSLQIAKEKLRQFESAQARGDLNPLPTKTPPADILEKFVKFLETFKTAKSLQTDVYYLRAMFGDICPALQITSRKRGPRTQKRPDMNPDGRGKSKTILARCIEDIATADISEFITAQVRSRGLAPKTANRYREILHRLFSWAMKQAGVKMPGNTNPAAAVERYKEKAPEIRFLTLPQIDEQLNALANTPQLRAMVAMLIYGGVRREELLWLTHDDIDLKTGPFGMIRVRAKTIDGDYWQPPRPSETGLFRSAPVCGPFWRNTPPDPAGGGGFSPARRGSIVTRTILVKI